MKRLSHQEERRRIFQSDRLRGWSYEKIAAERGVSRSTVRRLLIDGEAKKERDGARSRRKDRKEAMLAKRMRDNDVPTAEIAEKMGVTVRKVNWWLKWLRENPPSTSVPRFVDIREY